MQSPRPQKGDATYFYGQLSPFLGSGLQMGKAGVRWRECRRRRRGHRRSDTPRYARTQHFVLQRLTSADNALLY